MAEPQILKDKKQILIKALKKKYEIQYNGIKPIPYIQERLYCVDNVFVESGVNASIGGAASHKAVQWERLESYKTIFTDPRMRSNRRIIEGEPGYGKSTLTLQLAYDWCNGVPDSPLYDVEILILLKLRQMGNVTSIYKAIKLYLIPDERRIKIRDIRKIIESCRSVAFQLDGYDEYPGKEKGNDVGRIMMLQMFPEYDVTLTTRYLPKEYVKSNTNRFKLIGFDDAARDEYIRKAVCGNNEQAVAKVKKGLKENVILDDLCQVPLLFSMFSHMTHEREDFQKFKSVTDFFRYMMGCFHHHTRNKAEEYNVERYATMFEANHEELSKVAFEGLSKENQQIVWEKVSLIKRLGEGFYNHHIRVGILVEEEVFVITDGPDTPGKNIKTKTEVSFYHKIFCEWFASFHVTGIAAGVKDPAELEPSLGKMDPFDLQYVFRFACGLNSGAGSNIIEYLKSKKGGDKFAILCILEQSGKFDGIMETVKELCSKRLIISKNDTKLLQRSTIQLLQIASSHDIPICDLVLQFSFNKVQHGDILLKSGLCLPLFSSLEKISINEGSGNLISEDNVIGLLNYGIQSEKFRELWFFNCELPEFIGPGMIPGTAKSRQIKVLWPSHASQLDLQSGEWRKADDIQTIKSLCSGTVAINNRTSESVQRSVIEVLVKASNHDIPIYSVDLVYSFNKVDEDDITLYSGLSLPILTSIERMYIDTENGREINKHEVNEILNYVQHSQRFKELGFKLCLLPSSIPSSALSGLKSNLNVLWHPYGAGKRSYRLNKKTGAWLIYEETASLFHNKAIGDKLTDADYTEEVRAFREHFRDHPWQKEKQGSGLT
ncbi:uncharacterized protein [Apostichopus japonicus]|uniref:uncharacterized protein isoform X4 n=1 Tax=Stichopus japonicus TaxID=307972 RepID=UPI003AB5C7FB